MDSESDALRWPARWLLAVLTSGIALAASGTALWIANRVTGRTSEDATTMLHVSVSAVFGIAAARTSFGWIRAGVIELLALGADTAGTPLFETPLRSELPATVLAQLAATIREVVDTRAGVTIDVWPLPTTPSASSPWHRGASACVGTMSNSPIELSVDDASRVYGVVRVSRRRRRPVSAIERRRLEALVRHVSLIVSSAVLREELSGSRQQLVLAREEERQLLRRNLHDGLGPSLAAMKLHVARARRRLDGRGAEDLDELHVMVSDATDEVRRVVEDLRPPLLDECGLVEALRNLRFVPPTVDLRITAPVPLPSLPAAVEVALYRIACEAVHNTVRHADANRCSVTFRFDADSAYVTVADDGRGFNSTVHGVGTAAMSERAQELGGALTIASSPNGGTRIDATIPLPRNARA